MKIHSVFNYKLQEIKVKCVTTYSCNFIPLFVNKIISAIFRIYQLTDKNRRPKRKLSQNLILDSPIF
ncbi:hypothetical protein BCE_2992 [Bacillus cereus ATCC 10987]|uniref:Uncharacterized protein n=1 Tax=Bacillus cereus (strain ATCC 10987 / NRS 248) TaxID=222523 RepID=Q736A9_BACC1|nr:hypothetical protein BCE_2992 [Bacillus cereus ATCC 10987]